MSKIESLLFVTGDEGLSSKQIENLTGATSIEVKEALEKLQDEYIKSKTRGIELKELAGTYQLISKRQNAETIQRLVENPTNQPLSQASLEVLAIVAYKQPITRIEIEDLRGVKSERPLHTLSLKGLIQEVGRAEGTGRAILYGTTKEFLNVFGLNDMNELPPLPETQGEEDDDQTDLFMTKFQEAFGEQQE
ncbi:MULTISPECIES: SMC-Scp complex subunit ScpB [Paenisporosarcina]|jgi:segregation and condensation protein B|uniref:Segregation and condensation protein B n=1 Tax=Paenisporosarcina quisquiliarum TaxID=365346 RepID=A0A9X3RBY3_9BACL|nr:SMC-Scp complex subunit ScpB [Paenisporosarcina quisquiliarum]MCZ8535741.1 SMC-Scp complex subunit ScpB [Paenisporosarcina quisquiliarum]